MKRAEQLVAEIRAYCAAHADEKAAGKWVRYFKEGYDAWGLLDKHDPLWNERQQGWLEEYCALGPRGFLKAGELLFQSGKYEEGALAIRFLKHYREQLDASVMEALAKWFAAGIGNWAHTDVLCGEVLAPLVESGRVTLEDLAPWRESKWKYQRRAVPVAMLSLVKTRKDVKVWLEFLRPLMTDSERVVQQGLGWFLREAWKKHPRPVEAFLLEWRQQAPRLIFQYSTEKMAAAERARFRRTR